ncbi:27815_t:CDS:2, partial [Racocetra persica]
MSASASQNEGFIEVKIDEEPEVKGNEKKSEDKDDETNTDEEDEMPSKYFAISPEGDFAVEFILKEDFEFELQMYTIEKLDNNEGLPSTSDSVMKDDLKLENDIDLEDDKKTSYRELSSIPTSFKFTDKQLNLIKNEHENIFSAVSDKSTSLPEYRLLAISFINIKDMKYYRESTNGIHPIETLNHGFTFVFMIKNEDYSINYIKELQIEYGGIVKLFSKNDNIIDGHLLIILAISGIYKYHVNMNKFLNINYVQKLKYPKRIYNAIIYNTDVLFSIGYEYDKACYNAYDSLCGYIKYCINKHYFLVDTINGEIGYIELYDLKTNQLVNIFQRQILFKSIIIDIPTLSYAISNNNKLLAYVSLSIKGIEIYSIECGLKIAELVDILDIEGLEKEMFINFFHNDEMLFIYLSKEEWTVWNIFSSLQDSVQLEDPGFILELPLVNFDGHQKIERSNSFMVVDKDDKLAIYDDLIVNKYLKHLKQKSKQDWKQLSSEYFSRDDLENKIRDLHDDESELDEYYRILDPYGYSQYSFYLDEKKEKLLLIEEQTLQVWHNQVKITSIKYCIGKFELKLKFSIQKTDDVEGSHQIEMEDKIEVEKDEIKMGDEIKKGENKTKAEIKIESEIRMEDYYIMNVAKYSCYSLEILSNLKKFEQFFDKDRKLKFNNIIQQTRKIILRFIRLHPSAWRLLDIRFDLMSVLIRAKEYELVNDILSFGELVHILLDYYSNNAVDNLGLMNTVADIIPELFESFYTYSITQLVPQDSKLDLREIDYDKIVDIRMVPLPDFATNKRILTDSRDIIERKLKNFIKFLIFPSQYSSLKEEDHSPFVKLIINCDYNIREIIYENPSMGAVMNWM